MLDCCLLGEFCQNCRDRKFVGTDGMSATLSSFSASSTSRIKQQMRKISLKELGAKSFHDYTYN